MQQLADTIRSILQKRKRKPILDSKHARAGVLIPLFYKDSEIHVLFGRRSGTVKHHKHQISFPGGLSDASDGSIEATAVRETFEEMGIKQADIDVLGCVDDFHTITDFIVTPVVGIFPYPYDFILSRREVAYRIEVPIAHVMEPSNSRVERRRREDGTEVDLHFYDYRGDVIWGATARMLKHFLDTVMIHATQ